MAADDIQQANGKRWTALKNVLEREGPFCKEDFVPSNDIIDYLQNDLKVLVIGAGGLGCELLKDLALMGFGQLHVIDMDTIDLSNLNRQFLFRHSDIGKSKAECAANFINKRIKTCHVTPHYKKIQDFDESFYSEFGMVVCGLDSIDARRWISGMLIGLLRYNNEDEENPLDFSSIIPLIDGGTEGFKGNARVILPGITPCIDCTLDLFPPQINYPLCTIANTPRLPEHCIEYVKLIQWEKESPYKEPLDGDDPAHLLWVFERAAERAKTYNITDVTYRLTQGVIKHIIPAVASTNAVIAAACASEAFKMATGSYHAMDNYMNFNDLDGIYTYTYAAEKSGSCMACGNAKYIEIGDPDTTTLDELIALLRESPQFRLKSPGLTAFVNGSRKTLYMANNFLEQHTRHHLTQSLTELGLKHGDFLYIDDVTSPNSLTAILKFKSKEDDQMME